MPNNPTDLKASGLKATLPRLKILEIFQGSSVRHLSAEDVYKILLADNMDVGQTTIVRDAWERGQELTIHSLIYGIQDGLLRDLGVSISAPEEMAGILAEAFQAYE